MVTIEKLKEDIEALGYYATEELLYDTFNAICMFEDGIVEEGQDIYAICLEGPPGAGKTKFAKVYTKYCNMMFNGNVKMVDYQCDSTTGKNELFEDINITAVVSGDSGKVNIPGKIIEALNLVNQGKKVVLFIDEYDKAREETDSLFLQLMQDGKINSVQHGDLEIKEEYKGNLHIIFCKNDMREELSGPLARRLRPLRLDYMEPSTFYEVAKRKLIDERKDKVAEGLLNLVCLMYQQAYNSRDIYNRLPSCSEMLIAITDADRLMKRANAPQYIIYNTIIKNMFKSVDDIKTFENDIEKNQSKDQKLASLIKSMKGSKEQTDKSFDLNELIAKKVFASLKYSFEKKASEMQDLIQTYKEQFEKMEKERRKAIELEMKKIQLENGTLVRTSRPDAEKNFDDESLNIKRGYNIFDTINGDWIDIGTIYFENLSHRFLIETLKQLASRMCIKIYENGIMLIDNDDTKLIIIKDKDEDKKERYRLMSPTLVSPSTYIKEIKDFIEFMISSYKAQPQPKNNKQTGINGVYSINTIIYNDNPMDLESIKENVYSIDISGRLDDLEELDKLSSEVICNDYSNATAASEEILKGKARVKNNE